MAENEPATVEQGKYNIFIFSKSIQIRLNILNPLRKAPISHSIFKDFFINIEFCLLLFNRLKG